MPMPAAAASSHRRLQATFASSCITRRLVSRTMEDYVTWVDTSRIKRTIMRYNDKLDDYDLL